MLPRVLPVPCLRDNYAYLVWLPGSTQALVVDASESEPVLRALEREKLELAAVLATHHHLDHVGGHEAIAEAVPGIEIVCSEHDKERIPCVTRTVRNGETLALAGLTIRVIAVPGHTLGAVAYLIGDAVFTGDTLFVAGCGRLFEGTPAQMWGSLCGELARLPPATRVFCGHEYTLANARFAHSIEPNNAAISALTERANECRARGVPTVPSTIGEELLHNPFLRVDEPALRACFADDDPVARFAALRRAKDAF